MRKSFRPASDSERRSGRRSGWRDGGGDTGSCGSGSSNIESLWRDPGIDGADGGGGGGRREAGAASGRGGEGRGCGCWKADGAREPCEGAGDRGGDAARNASSRGGRGWSSHCGGSDARGFGGGTFAGSTNLTRRFSLDLADRFLEREALAGDVGLVERRRHAAQLRKQSCARALVDSTACLAAVLLKTGDGAGYQWVIVGHRS